MVVPHLNNIFCVDILGRDNVGSSADLQYFKESQSYLKMEGSQTKLS
ncbi:MAG: hypothetical protein AAFZ15_24175 [Bacteroidota bacterium]